MSTVAPGDYGHVVGAEKIIDPTVEMEYEYTSSATSEYVAGRIGKRGSAERQVKWWTANTKATCVILKCIDGKGVDGSGYQDDHYAASTSKLKVAIGGDFEYLGCLVNGQVITRGDPLMPQTATGKLLKLGYGGVYGPVVAIALETLTATADQPILVKNCIGEGAINMLVPVTETLDCTTNVATLTYTPLAITAVHQYATTTSGACHLTTGALVRTLDCLLTLNGKTLTFASDSNVTSCKVTYLAAL